MGDRYSCTRTYHQLGNVAQDLREYDQARDYYQQALEIKIEFGDRYSQALFPFPYNLVNSLLILVTGTITPFPN
jgi:hypothetical protein